MTTITKQIFTALDNAAANGYDMVGCDPTDVAYDLVTHDADVEQLSETVEFQTIVSIVKEYMAKRKGGKR